MLKSWNSRAVMRVLIWQIILSGSQTLCSFCWIELWLLTDVSIVQES